LQCGASATYHFSSRAFSGPGHFLEIFGSKGALMYRFFAEEILGTSPGASGMQAVPIPESEERAHSTDYEFIRAIRGGTRVSPTFEDGVGYMALCDAVAFSALQGGSVAVDTSKPRMQAWGQPLRTA